MAGEANGNKVIAIDGAKRSDVSAERYRAGQVIASKYRLDRELGHGGMGAVWLARNLTLDVDVAIKLVRRDVTAAEASARLLREARAAARLEHPSIVRVYDFGETEHRDPFIVMEVVRGESLAQVIDRKGRLDATVAVQMLLPIVDALSVAHGRGIIHRDVKPDNIILMTGDKGTLHPKLVDFGIAKDAPRDFDAAPIAVATATPTARRLTQAGAIVGSPDYMSPEQASGATHIDYASDVWSLCVVLYESACGVRPFVGSELGELTTAILRNDPTPMTEHGVGDHALWEIVSRGLDKDSQKRWPSMRAMGCEMAAWLAGLGVRTDITGAALEAHWLAEQSPRPLSRAPESSSDQVIDHPARRSDRSFPRGRTRSLIVVAVALVAVGVVATGLALLDPPPAQIEHDVSIVPAPPVLGTAAELGDDASHTIPSAPEPASPSAPSAPSTPAPSPTPSANLPPPSPPHAPKREQAAPSDPGF